jgi:membrane protease YdiL (CAAX protease family)
MRAFGTLGPLQFRPLLPLGFVLMALSPWLLLTRTGRQQIGLISASVTSVYFQAAITGALLALVIGALGTLLFGSSPQNWYVSVLASFSNSFDTRGKPTWLLFLVFTAPAVLFSPIGEEIFFRGVLQKTLEGPLSLQVATRLECGAFAIVHLCHHGLHREGDALALWLPSGLFWVALMYAAAHLFAHWRKRSGSVFPPIVSHMAFNGTMGAYIFAGY